MIAGEIAGELDLGTDMQIVNPDVLAYIVPELGLGDEHELVRRTCSLHEVNDILTPDIGEAAEAKALNAEKILHSPNEGELGRYVTGCAGAEGLVKELEIEGVTEVAAVQEVIQAEEEVLVYPHEAVVLYLEAERSESAVLPEVQAACNLHVASARRLVYALGVLVVVIIINEEEGVAPLVSIETLEGGGEVSTILSEIVESLEVGLCLCSLSEGKHCNSSGEE